MRSQPSRSRSRVGREHVAVAVAFGAQHPGAESGSLKRRSRMASSSSRHAASDSTQRRRTPDTVIVATPCRRSMSTDDEPPLERAEHDALGVVGSVGLPRRGPSARSRTSSANASTAARSRRPAPTRAACVPFDALGLRGEHVGEVAAHVALVDHPGQPAGAGQHGEQRHLGQRDRRRPIVDEQDLVARQRQLVAAAGRGAVDRGDHDLPAAGRHLLDAVAGLVRELAEVRPCGRASSRRASGCWRRRRTPCRAPPVTTTALHLGMLEAQPLHARRAARCRRPRS